MTMFTFTWRNCDVGYDTVWHVYACCVSQGITKILVRLTTLNNVLFQIYWSTRVPEIIKIELGLTMLLQKK